MGWTPTALCQTQTVEHFWEVWNDVWAVVLTGDLWVCGSHGWPYLPVNWTDHCTWGWSCLTSQAQKILVSRPTNWEVFKAQYQVKHTPWWCYPLAVFSPQAASILTEAEITALALHSADVLNATHDSLSLLNEEVYQLRKVALQNRMALDMFTASQGGVCALERAECCVNVPDIHHNVSQAFTGISS